MERTTRAIPDDADATRAVRGDRDADLRDPQFYIGRDLSWLSFNARVLAQARDPGLPLLERVKFLTIFESNLDEFFMKRVALMRHRINSGRSFTSHDGRTVKQQFDTARERVVELQREEAACWEGELAPALARGGIRLVSCDALSEDELERLDAWFRESVFPVLTPLAVDPGHRFPFISNLSESLGVLLRPPGEAERSFARLKIPDQVDRLVSVPRSGEIGEVGDAQDVRLVPLERVILRNLHEVFSGLEVAEVLPFRVTRSAGLEPEGEEVEDLLEHVEAGLRQRRFANPVRLETGPEPSGELLTMLLEELDLDPVDHYARRGPLEYADLAEIVRLDRPDLKQEPWSPVVPARLRDEDSDIFATIRQRDVLVHHPFESFTASVERFVAAAAEDPNVLAIKQTLYRTSRDSPFINSLIRAAEDGKSVACLVELRARFDEDKNVRFARHLEKHGVHVAYGVVGLKTHCKCSLVVRREHDGIRTYAHLGTGNYHPGTAQLYTDCGLLTCDQAITSDVVHLFNNLTGRSLRRSYNSILVAPTEMRAGFYALIDNEIGIARSGGRGRIVAKMNALEDVGIIAKLYEASCAGVEISLIVRGFCCLRPGVPGISENIRVISIIGRYLEHERVFHFGNGRDDMAEGTWLFGSADWMSRNLNDRVEAATFVEDAEARRKLARIFEVNLADRFRAWELGPYGTYTRLTPGDGADPESSEVLGSFERLSRDTVEASKREAV